MSLFTNFRDRFIVNPVAKQILDGLKVEKADTPNIFAVPIGFNSTMGASNKRMSQTNTDFTILRALSVNHETTRAAINTRKRQITQLGYEVIDLDDDVDPLTTKAQRQTARDIITNIGGEGVSFREVLNKLMEDLLVLDALVFYKQRTRDGKLLRIIPVDGATIKLRLGQAGETPLPPDFAYEQWIRGAKTGSFTTTELTYKMMNPKTDSAYGLSPIESLLITIDASMRAALYNLNYLSDNNVPQGFLAMPENWTVQQIKEYKEFFDSMVNVSKATSKVYPIPSGTTYQATSKPSDFSFKDFFDYLDRKVCMLFDIQPQELGLNLQQYKENAEGQERIGLRRGLKPLAAFLSEIFTDILRTEYGFNNFAFRFSGLDTRFTLEEAKILLPLGVLNIDEVRNDKGLAKLGTENIIITGKGAQLVSQIGQEPALGDNPEEDNPEKQDDNEENPQDKKKIEKRANPLDKLEKTKEYKDFHRQVKQAVKMQIQPYFSESTIDKVTATKKADFPDPEVASLDIYIDDNTINQFLKWAAIEGGQQAFTRLNISTPFNLTSERFAEIIGDRSNYLITSVDATTKQWLTDQIAQGKDKKLTNQEIARLISDQSDEFTSQRADMIVNTEVNNAASQTALDTYKNQGIEKKEWVLSENIGDECGDNADASPIPISDNFPSGDDAPPAHPRCRCYLDAYIE